MRLVKLTSSEDHIVTAALRQELDTLLIILVDQFSEILANHFLLDGEFVGTNVWDLEEHRRRHVDALYHFPVYVKMRWSL